MSVNHPKKNENSENKTKFQVFTEQWIQFMVVILFVSFPGIRSSFGFTFIVEKRLSSRIRIMTMQLQFTSNPFIEIFRLKIFSVSTNSSSKVWISMSVQSVTYVGIDI